MSDRDEFGLPNSRSRGRPIRLLSYKGHRRTAAKKRIRGGWPEAIENMQVGDSKSVTKLVPRDDYNANVAEMFFIRESGTIRTAKMRVARDFPQIRLRAFSVDRCTSLTSGYDHLLTITLTRLA